MPVLFSTLGYTAQLAHAPITEAGQYTRWHIFHEDPTPPQVHEALEQCQAHAKDYDVPISIHKVPDAFDYQSIIQALGRVAQDYDSKDITLNPSGGTRIMLMAATILAHAQGISIVYHDLEQHPDGFTVPLHAVHRAAQLTETKRQILRALQYGPVDMTGLSQTLGVNRSTINQHIHELSDSGLIQTERRGKHRYVSLAKDAQHAQDIATRPEGDTADIIGPYRYRLTRRISDDPKRLCVIMFNPSIADDQKDDRTIQKLVHWAKAWGYGHLDVVNLLAWRAQRPQDVPHGPETIGPLNDAYTQDAIQHADLVVAAWGDLVNKHAIAMERATQIRRSTPLHCVAKTAAKNPWHPVRAPWDATPQRFPE